MKDKIEKVIKLGNPLPIYDYEKRKFIATVPENIDLKYGGGVFGVELKSKHDSFESALDYIINFIEKRLTHQKTLKQYRH